MIGPPYVLSNGTPQPRRPSDTGSGRRDSLDRRHPPQSPAGSDCSRLNNRVMAVHLVRGNRVKVAGGPERVESPQVEQRGLPGATRRVEVGIRRTTSRPVTRSAFLWELNAVKGTSATCARDTHRPVSGSRTTSVYSIVVEASSAMPPIAALTFWSMRTVTDTWAPALAAPIVAWPSNAESARSAPCRSRRDRAGAAPWPSASRTSRCAPRLDPHDPFRSRCATITGARRAVVAVATERQTAHPAVPEPGALLVVAVDLDDRVVDIDQRPAPRRRGRQRVRPRRPRAGTWTRPRRADGHGRR